MLLAGDYTCIPDIKNLAIYNLSSLLEGCPRVDILPSVTQINYMNERDFDIHYSNYLLGNDAIFYELFSKIIFPLYNGMDIYLIVSRNIFYDQITESLFKFIQQRYQYPSILISEPDDVNYINPDVGFGINGVYNLDIDKNRFSIMYTNMNLTSNGIIKGFDKEE